MNTTTLLSERQTTHGDFTDNARHGQMLRDAFRSSPRWRDMPDVHREALDQIAGKISRILSGQSRFKDHWADISGYSTLAQMACDGD